MKKTVITFGLILMIGLVFGQWYYPEHIVEEIIDDPSVSYELNRPIQVLRVNRPEIAPEMELSNGKQFFKIPFAYPIKNIILGANLPILRITKTSGDKSKSAIGIGDITLNGAYSASMKDGFGNWSLDWAADLSIKLPTGDYEKTVKVNGNKLAAPTGTGSLDMTLAGNVLLGGEKNEIFFDGKYRLNGKNEDDYKNGNMFSLKGRFGFLQFEPKFDGYIALIMVSGAKGDADGTEIDTNIFMLDFNPELHYRTKLGMFKAGLTIPMLTSAENKITRDVSVRFGISKKY